MSQYPRRSTGRTKVNEEEHFNTRERQRVAHKGVVYPKQSAYLLALTNFSFNFEMISNECYD